MPCHWGNAALQRGHPVEPDRQPVPARRWAAPRPARYISRRHLPGCVGPRRRADLRVARRGGHLRGRVLGEPQHRLHACTSRSSTSSPTTATPSRCPSADQSPAPISELVAGFRGLHVHALDGRDYFEVRARAADIVAEVRAGVGPALIHATVTRPYSHSSPDTQSKYRSAEELAEEAAHDPLVADGAGPARRRASSPPTRWPPSRRRPARSSLGAARRGPRRAPPRPGDRHRPRGRPARSSDPAAEAADDGRARWSPSARPSGGPCTSRWRRTSASGSSARTSPTPARPCWPTSTARAACSAPPPVCSGASGWPAATTPRWPRPTSSGGPSARRSGACGRFPRSSSSTTSGRPCSRSRARRPPSAGAPTARSPARWCCGCRSAAT